MNILTHNSSKFFGLLLVTLVTLTSCEDTESGLDLIELEARFVTEINGSTVSFTNLSNDAVRFEWDLDNAVATPSTLVNPQESYENGDYTVTLTAFDSAGNSSTFQDSFTINLFDGGLIVNGDFENGAAPWIVGVDDNTPAPVVTVDGDTYYQVNITNPDPAQPFLVNLSQKLNIEPDQTYILTFDAWSDQDRDIIAGIGLSGGSFANNSQPVSITATRTNYQLTLAAGGFGASDARVLFDNNGAAGIVNIDNVTLNVQ